MRRISKNTSTPCSPIPVSYYTEEYEYKGKTYIYEVTSFGQTSLGLKTGFASQSLLIINTNGREERFEACTDFFYNWFQDKRSKG